VDKGEWNKRGRVKAPLAPPFGSALLPISGALEQFVT